MKKEIHQKLYLNNSEQINNTKNIQNNNNIVFYRKSSIQNRKTSFYHHKKNTNSPNKMAQNKNISGNTKKMRLSNYTIEDTNPSSKIKICNYSRDKSSIECGGDSTFEKIDIFKTSVSPFSLDINNNFKENKENNNDNDNTYINKKSQNPKNKIKSNFYMNHDKFKITNLTDDNCKNKNRSFSGLGVNYEQNENNNNKFIIINNTSENNNKNNKIVKIGKRKNKAIKSFEKKGINFTFKDSINNNNYNNNDKNSFELINTEVVVNYPNKSIDNTKNNNVNEILKPNKNNFITIETDNSLNNKRIKTYNKNSFYLNKNMIYNKNRDSKYQISGHNNLNNNTNDFDNDNGYDKAYINLSKGKIIKFKYNGSEFFFHPTHNKAHNEFFNKTTNNNPKKSIDIVKSCKIIQKWWRKRIFTKIIVLKHKFNFFVKSIKNTKIRQILQYMKYKILFINNIIFIQRKWRIFNSTKKENISSIYIKNDTYGCDNSNKNNLFGDNFYINTSEFINTIEDNNNSKIFNNIINNKNNNPLNDLNFGQSLKRKLFHSNSNNNNNSRIIKRLCNNYCFYTKEKYNNSLNKIIFLQKKIKKYLRNIFTYNIRKLYENIYRRNIFNPKNISEFKNNYFSIQGKDNNFNKKTKFNNYKITNSYFCIKKNSKQSKSQLLNIIKNDDIILDGIVQNKNKNKKNVLNIEKSNEIKYLFKPKIKLLQLSKNAFEIINNNKNIKIFDIDKVAISSKIEFNINPQKKKAFIIDKTKILFSIKSENIENSNKIKDENITELIKSPLIKNICHIEKVYINKKYLMNIKNIQKIFRNYKNNKNRETTPIKIKLKPNNKITKIYKDNSLNIKKISKIQKYFKSHINKKEIFYFRPININIYTTKIYIRKKKIIGLAKFKMNNNLNIITSNDNDNDINNKNTQYYNNIDEFFYEKDEQRKFNDITKYTNINSPNLKLTNERNSTYINEEEENRDEIPIKIMNTKLYKNSINFNLDNYNNIKPNININNNKYINIDSLPSYNSLKTNSDKNELSNCDTNKMNISRNNKFITNNISIQTLESKDSKDKFKDNLMNLSNIKRVTTEEVKFKNNPIIQYPYPYQYEAENNYFYTENDIARFSFSNGDINFLTNSIFRKTTKNYSYMRDYINKHIIKIISTKLKIIIYQYNIYVFIQIIIKRIQKNINKYALNKIFKRKNNINFYSIIKKHIKIYNEIMKDKNNTISYHNDIIKLIGNNIFNKYLYENNKNKFLYISDIQEKNLIKTNLFINNDKDLINYYFYYYKSEYKLLDEKQYYNLIQFRLIKEPLINLNLFAITKYMDELYFNIIHNNRCKKCYCKIDENCSINCNCHMKNNNSINLINKIKNKISHNKSFNIESSKKDEDFDSINQKEKRNIKIIIKKIKRSSADIIRTRNNNLEESNEVSSSNNDIDVFQKMNTGIKSLINKVKINKAFKDFNQTKKNKNSMIKIGRTLSEFGDKKKNDNISENNEHVKYNTLFYNIKNDNSPTPEKKIYSFNINNRIFGEK